MTNMMTDSVGQLGDRQRRRRIGLKCTIRLNLLDRRAWIAFRDRSQILSLEQLVGGLAQFVRSSETLSYTSDVLAKNRARFANAVAARCRADNYDQRAPRRDFRNNRINAPNAFSHYVCNQSSTRPNTTPES